MENTYPVESENKTEEARKILEAEAQERGKRAMSRIKAILEEEKCDLSYYETKVNGQIVNQGFQTTPRQ